jgi:hypothetical protein
MQLMRYLILVDFNIIDSLSVVLTSLIMALYYGFLFAIIATTAFGCLSVVLLKSIIGSQVDLEMKSIFAKGLSQINYGAI